VNLPFRPDRSELESAPLSFDMQGILIVSTLSEPAKLKIFGNLTTVVICLAVMAICLAFEGFVLAFSDFSAQHISPLTRVLGVIWILTVVSCFAFFRWPILSIVGQGTTFLINGISLWRSDPDSHFLDWFLYVHSVELLFLAAACVGAVAVMRVPHPARSIRKVG